MNELKVFDYNNKMVRTVEKDGIYWWVLKDVCKVLKITNPTMILKRLEEDEVTKSDLGGNVGVVNLINESGLYNVIIRSDKSEAKPFRKWVTSEVLPSIRKTGSYSTNQQPNANMMTEMMQSLFQSQQDNNKQLIQMLNIITSQLPKQFTPPFTRWIRETYEKVDKLALYCHLTRKEMLNRLYVELEDTYDSIDLKEAENYYCIEHNLDKAFTINVIDANTELKKLFDLLIDTSLDQIVDDKQYVEDEIECHT